MTALLELRENLKKIYSRNEAFITPVIKFLLSFIVLSIINGKMGYMTKLDNMAIVLIVSLLCSFLPTGFIVLFAMMFSLLHMYALSLETAAVGLVAMVAMTPLITIQILGMVYQLKQQKSGAGVFAGAADAFGALDENAIIEL